jgi:hypothetical protein
MLSQSLGAKCVAQHLYGPLANFGLHRVRIYTRLHTTTTPCGHAGFRFRVQILHLPYHKVLLIHTLIGTKTIWVSIFYTSCSMSSQA